MSDLIMEVKDPLKKLKDRYERGDWIEILTDDFIEQFEEPLLTLLKKNRG